jgi:hypothetical protein
MDLVQLMGGFLMLRLSPLVFGQLGGILGGWVGAWNMGGQWGCGTVFCSLSICVILYWVNIYYISFGFRLDLVNRSRLLKLAEGAAVFG